MGNTVVVKSLGRAHSSDVEPSIMTGGKSQGLFSGGVHMRITTYVVCQGNEQKFFEIDLCGKKNIYARIRRGREEDMHEGACINHGKAYMHEAMRDQSRMHHQSMRA
jgi:hypothetical protein